MLVDLKTHRIKKNINGVFHGVWMMYCPVRGPYDIIYAVNWEAVLIALEMNTPCPHDGLLR